MQLVLFNEQPHTELVTLSSVEMAYSRPVLDGQHREVEITLYSQDGSALQISDTDLSLALEHRLDGAGQLMEAAGVK